MYFDGSLMKTGVGAGLLFISPLGKHLRYVLRLHFLTSNNVAEYEALVNELCIAIELRVRRLDARGDSQLVIDQVMKAPTVVTERWRPTATRFGAWKTSSTDSSSTTSPDGTTRLRMNWLR
jgi:ribonuclease HI